MYPPTSWIYDSFLLRWYKMMSHSEFMFSRGWHGVADVWVGNNEPMEWKVAKLSCLSPTVLNPHFPGALLITLRIKTSRWCSRHTCHVPLGWADSNSADSSMFFFLRGHLQLFPGLFPWNLQLSSRFFLKLLQWSLHPHICHPHYIPTIFPLHPQKPIIFLPKKKDFQAAGRSDPSARMSPAPAAWHWRVVAVWTARWPTCTWPKAMPREAGPDLSEGIFLGRSTSGE